MKINARHPYYSRHDLQEHRVPIIELLFVSRKTVTVLVICTRLSTPTNSMSNMTAQKNDPELAIHEENMNLRQTLTISPELFEKVRKPSSIHWCMILTALSCI